MSQPTDRRPEHVLTEPAPTETVITVASPRRQPAPDVRREVPGGHPVQPRARWSRDRHRSSASFSWASSWRSDRSRRFPVPVCQQPLGCDLAEHSRPGPVGHRGRDTDDRRRIRPLPRREHRFHRDRLHQRLRERRLGLGTPCRPGHLDVHCSDQRPDRRLTRIPSFIATLGMGFFWVGASIFVNGTSPAILARRQRRSPRRDLRRRLRLLPLAAALAHRHRVRRHGRSCTATSSETTSSLSAATPRPQRPSRSSPTP